MTSAVGASDPSTVATVATVARRAARARQPMRGIAADPARTARTGSRAVVADEPPSVAELEGQCRVDLPEAGFEGPLDLLLHLIQTHELDILDIPVAFVTERYLAYLRLMESLTIDLASEYLVMAATLVHIKSKMLLPTVPADQDGDALATDEDQDPRAELVRRLLEYQKYKAAAQSLEAKATLSRDLFPRGASEPIEQGIAPFAPLGLFSLVDAFEAVLKRSKVRIDHEVIFDRISITDRILELTERLRTRRTMRFDELFVGEGARPGDEPKSPSRFELVITFLAVLEMCKSRLLRVFQSETCAPIHLELTMSSSDSDDDEPMSFAYAPSVDSSSIDGVVSIDGVLSSDSSGDAGSDE